MFKKIQLLRMKELCYRVLYKQEEIGAWGFVICVMTLQIQSAI